ncbi:unnamed protein product [Mytilus coruscus]|uniref:NCAM n=1 Tax=Mytilus coruscus TaxID=42192 RepID=A0A6J8BEQ4_MYTCO|nr:unnamed protein product [Mytilus coruscus]
MVIPKFRLIQVYVMFLTGLNLVTANENISTYLVIGSSVVMNCPMDKIDNNPSWSRKGDLLAFGMNIRNDTQLQYQRLRLVGQEHNQYNLMILNVTQTDEDEYCCISTYKNNSIQYCTRLKLIELKITPETVDGIDGQHVCISCSLTKDGIIGNLTWIYSGSVLKSELTEASNVTLKLSKENHEQTMRCLAYIQQFNASLEQLLTFNISYKPIVKVMVFPSAVLRENDTFELSCSYDGNPIASQIRWIIDGTVLSTGPEHKVTNISRQHSGLYRCIVNNDIGSGMDEVAINVLYAPDVNVVQFLNDSLYCNATGVPKNYTFLKWEHQSFNGHHLRYLNVESAILTIAVTDDNPLYNLDGRYWCTVSNGVPDSNDVSLQTGYIDLNWPGRPWCVESNPLRYGQKTENVTVVFHVYSYNISTYQWFKDDEQLQNSSKHQFSSNISCFQVNIFGRDVHIETKMIYLEILNVTENDFNAAYTLKVNNYNGNETCFTKLQEGSFPEKPKDFDIKPHGTGFNISWISRFNGGYPQNFILKYRYVLDANWRTVNVTNQQLSFNKTCTEFIQGLSKDKEYITYMYAENVIGKSGYTDLVSVKTNSVRNEEQENNIFNNITEKLLISLTLTLLLVVTTILCCLFARNCRKHGILSPSARNQAYTVNTNGHYEEIDGALEINIDNSLSPGNQIELREMRGAEQNLVLLQNSIQTMKETVDVAMRDIAKQALTETIIQVIKETQLEMIRGALRQVLSENSDSQLYKRRSSASSESGPDANEENQETGYLNPYQPLHINVESCEHPYTDSTLNDAPLDICSRETK